MLALGNYTRRESFAGLGATYMPEWPAGFVCPNGYEPSLSSGGPRCYELWTGREVNPVRASTPMPSTPVMSLVTDGAGGAGISKPVLIATAVGLLGLAVMLMK